MASASPKAADPLWRRKPSKPAVAALLVLLAVVLFSRERIADMARLRGILNAHAPDTDVIRRVVDHARYPVTPLRRLWDSGKIPHRWEVIDYINRHASTDPELVTATADLIAEAARDRDLTVRVAAMNLARIAGHPHWISAAIADLNDPDEGLRLEALHTLHRGKTTNALPEIVARLKDPHPATARFAAGVVHNFTGIPHSTIATNATAAVDDWLAAHRPPLSPLATDEPFEPPPGPDFSDLVLETAQGKPLPLTSLAGRPVLLCFLGTWSGECTLQMPELRALKTLLGDQIHLIAIGIDPLSNTRSKHGTEMTPEAAKKHVLRLAAIQRANYPIAFDPEGLALLRMEDAEIPAHILLGPDLHLLRRFTGRQRAANLQQIITALTKSLEN